MTDVISVKFKSCGKNYFFDPAGVVVNKGDKVIVETVKGPELAECTYGNHSVDDTVVIQPLRPVVRKATDFDLKSAEQNKAREKEALGICREKIKEHGLDMKLVDVECSFDGTKTTFFFTSDGRVDFRELVKDLAGIFHNRIELRQIGVRDEAKMIGGIGICGRPYCCHQFLEEFAPVSTKMAKVQSLSLNPAKISGSCGRLMCCLRYEEDAYEDLLTKVPKQGAYVETADGYGVAAQINLLRQTVKVSLDNESDESVHLYAASEVATVPGGRPKDGEEAPHVLQLREKSDEEETEEDKVQDEPLFAREWSLTADTGAQFINNNMTGELPNSDHDDLQKQNKDNTAPAVPAQSEKNTAQGKSGSENETDSEAALKRSRSRRRYRGKKNSHVNPADNRQEKNSQETNIDSRKASDHKKAEEKETRTKNKGNNGKNTKDNTKDNFKSSGNSGNGHRTGKSNPQNSQPITTSEKQTANHAPATENAAGTEKKQPRKNNNYYRKKYNRKPKTNSSAKTDDHSKA